MFSGFNRLYLFYAENISIWKNVFITMYLKFLSISLRLLVKWRSMIIWYFTNEIGQQLEYSSRWPRHSLKPPFKTMTADYLKLKLTIAQELDQESDSFEPPWPAHRVQASLAGRPFHNTKQKQNHDNTSNTSSKLLRKCRGLFLDRLFLCRSCWLRLMHHHILPRKF